MAEPLKASSERSSLPDSSRGHGMSFCSRNEANLSALKVLYEATWSHPGLALLSGHKKGLWQATFSPDGKKILTASEDNTARLWSTKTGEQLAVLAAHEDTISHVAFSPDGTKMLTASLDNTARIWSTGTGKPHTILRGHESGVLHATFSPDGNQVVTASWDNTARLWSMT